MAQQHVAENFYGFGGSITDLVDHFSKSFRKKTCSAPSTDRWITVRYQKLLHMLVPTFPSFAFLDLCFTEILPFFV
jgi:hypothetical protein